jgi:hypothetical protein
MEEGLETLNFETCYNQAKFRYTCKIIDLAWIENCQLKIFN